MPDIEPQTQRRSAREKRRYLSPESPPPPPTKKKKKKQTNAERMKAYRLKLKEDPERYEHYLAESKLKCKQYRANLSTDQKRKVSQMSKLRTQKCRAKKKEEEKKGPEKVKTRRDQQAAGEQRAKWRELYRHRAESEHWKTREARNARRREAYQQKKLAKTITSQISKDVQVDSSDSTGESRTPAARRKALQRARDSLPLTPELYVETIQDLVEKATPRKRALLRNRYNRKAQHAGRLFLSALEKIKARNSSKDRTTRRVFCSVLDGLGESIKWKSALLGIHATTMSRYEIKGKATEKTAKKENEVQKQAAAYIEDAATQLPDKKLVSKKTGKPASQLQKPLKELHQEFTAETGKNIGFSTFAKCRPSAVRKLAQGKLRQCLCEYCTNVKLKMATLNAVSTIVDQRCHIRSERHAVELLTCDSKRKECCYSTCVACGVRQLHGFLEPLEQHQAILKWYRWENRVVDARGKQVSRKMLLSKRGTIQDLIGEFEEEVKFLAQHLFRANWQFQQFRQQRDLKPFPPESVLMVLDFAENFACTYQEEVQAAHWHHDQVTVHPAVTFYLCPTPGCSETVTESLVFISADLKHDFHAVHHFNLMALAHLRCVRGLTIKEISQWTDGCSAQYKSKGPFADIACSLDDFGATLERNFFGSRHGKGPSDGESAVVKQAAATAVVAGRAVIASAADLFNFCTESSLCKQPLADGCRHFLRTFFWVGDGDIQRQREDRAAQTVPGTRSFHSVRCVEKGVVMARHLACSCHPCRSGTGDCTESAVVGDWATHNLRAPGQQCRRPHRQQRCPPAHRPAQRLRPRRLQLPDHDPHQVDVPDSPAPSSQDIEEHVEIDIPTLGDVPTSPAPSHNSEDNDHHPIPAAQAPQPSPVDTSLTGLVSQDGNLPTEEPRVLSSSTESSSQDHQIALPALTAASTSNSSHESSSIRCGSWVEKEYLTKRGQQTFRGQVITYDESTRRATVKFLKSHGKYYTFPSVDDLDFEVEDHELKLLREPVINSRLHHSFDEQ